MAFLRIIVIIILVFYLVRFLDRHVVPFFLGKPEEKSKKSTGKRGQEFQRKTRRGDVTITDFGGKKKDIKSREDDYVDFEEVE